MIQGVPKIFRIRTL